MSLSHTIRQDGQGLVVLTASFIDFICMNQKRTNECILTSRPRQAQGIVGKRFAGARLTSFTRFWFFLLTSSEIKLPAFILFLSAICLISSSSSAATEQGLKQSAIRSYLGIVQKVHLIRRINCEMAAEGMYNLLCGVIGQEAIAAKNVQTVGALCHVITVL